MARDGGASVCVIGVGNELRGDDAAGLVAARRISERAPPGVAVIEAGGEGTALLGLWAAADAVFIIDAVRSGAAAGTVRRYDAATTPLPSSMFHYSSHAVSVADAIELARAMGALPRRVVVYGIEGVHFAAGAGVSPVVDRAIDEVVRRVKAELNAMVAAEA